MANFEVLVCIICVAATIVESRFIPKQESSHYRVPGRRFVYPSRRGSNVLYSNILKRQNNQIRRNPIIPNYVSRHVNSEQYQTFSRRSHSHVDSLIKRPNRKLNENVIFRNKNRNSKNRFNLHNSADKVKLFKNRSERNRKLSINLNYNGDHDLKSMRRNIQIKANNIHKLRLSNAIKGSNIIINKQGRNTRIHILKSPTLRRKNIENDLKIRTSKPEVRKAVVKNHLSHENNFQNGIKRNSRAKFDSVTLNPASWVISTKIPSKHSSTYQTRTFVNTTSKPNRTKGPAVQDKHFETKEMKTHTTKQVTTKFAGSTSDVLFTTQLPSMATVTEEPDFPDVTDLPEVPDNTESTYEQNALD